MGIGKGARRGFHSKERKREWRDPNQKSGREGTISHVPCPLPAEKLLELLLHFCRASVSPALMGQDLSPTFVQKLPLPLRFLIAYQTFLKLQVLHNGHT